MKKLKIKILEFIKNLPDDKKDHHVSGQIGAIALLGLLLVFALLSWLFGLNPKIVIGVINFTGVSFILYYGYKEVVKDWIQKKGTPSWGDWFWNSISVATVLVSINVINWIL